MTAPTVAPAEGRLPRWLFHTVVSLHSRNPLLESAPMRQILIALILAAPLLAQTAERQTHYSSSLLPLSPPSERPVQEIARDYLAASQEAPDGLSGVYLAKEYTTLH